MITRCNLVQAIYDNEDEWSCQSPCQHTMEEEKPGCVCYTCAEKKLKEYEDSIRRQTIEEFVKQVNDLLATWEKNWYSIPCVTVRSCMKDIAEQMKGEL